MTVMTNDAMTNNDEMTKLDVALRFNNPQGDQAIAPMGFFRAIRRREATLPGRRRKSTTGTGFVAACVAT